MTASMSRKGNCWDNAVAESFFATLEWELLADADFATRAMGTRALVPTLKTGTIGSGCTPPSIMCHPMRSSRI
jgi:hypothetical protein